MTVELLIDGSSHTGNYSATCKSCGDCWTGQGERLGLVNFCPAPVIAECVVHVKMGHGGDPLAVTFSERFRLWLISYWEHENARVRDDQAWRRRMAIIQQARAK